MIDLFAMWQEVKAGRNNQGTQGQGNDDGGYNWGNPTPPPPPPPQMNSVMPPQAPPPVQAAPSSGHVPTQHNPTAHNPTPHQAAGPPPAPVGGAGAFHRPYLPNHGSLMASANMAGTQGDAPGTIGGPAGPQVA